MKKQNIEKTFFLFEAFWFAITQVFGILLAKAVINLSREEGRPIQQISSPDFSIAKFLISFFGTVVVIFLITKLSRGKNIIFKTLLRS